MTLGPLLHFWTLFLSLISIPTQLMGQLLLVFGTVALLAHLEVLDSVCDVNLKVNISSGYSAAVIPCLMELVNIIDTMEICILVANRYLSFLTPHCHPQNLLDLFF